MWGVVIMVQSSLHVHCRLDGSVQGVRMRWRLYARIPSPKQRFPRKTTVTKETTIQLLTGSLQFQGFTLYGIFNPFRELSLSPVSSSNSTSNMSTASCRIASRLPSGSLLARSLFSSVRWKHFRVGGCSSSRISS